MSLANRCFLVLALLSASFASFAEIPISAPTGTYTDQDAAAVYFPIKPGRRAEYRKWLSAALATHPRNPVLLSYRAYLFQEGGDLDLAVRDFNKAIQYAEPDTPVERNVYWSLGWANYDQGDYAGALANWLHTIGEHGGKPYWQAYTFALLYWTAGDRDIALDWYAAAVRSDRAWGNEEGFAEKTKYWRPLQKERMRQLFELWRSKRST